MAFHQYPVHSLKQIMITSLSACALAIVIFISIILPAEFGIDPLGTGQLFGLEALNNAKNQRTYSQTSQNKHSITINVPAYNDTEYKIFMSQYQQIEYDWVASGQLYFDFHGEPISTSQTGAFQSFIIASSYETKGSFMAPFTGAHGWHFKNNTEKPIAVYLKLSGAFQTLEPKQ